VIASGGSTEDAAKAAAATAVHSNSRLSSCSREAAGDVAKTRLRRGSAADDADDIMDTMRELEQFALRQKHRADSAEQAAVQREANLLSLEQELNVINIYMGRAYGTEAVSNLTALFERVLVSCLSFMLSVSVCLTISPPPVPQVSKMRSAVRQHLEGSSPVQDTPHGEPMVSPGGSETIRFAQVEANMLKYYFFGVTSRLDPSLDPEDVLHYSDEPGYGSEPEPRRRHPE